MTSHQYAERLKGLAEFLLSRPVFETTNSKVYESIYFLDKEPFIAAAKALGSGKKKYTENNLEFIPNDQLEGVEFYIYASRSTLCRLIRPAEYECDPFLQPEEEAQLEQAS